jgi:hypothetical protein
VEEKNLISKTYIHSCEPAEGGRGNDKSVDRFVALLLAMTTILSLRGFPKGSLSISKEIASHHL